MEPLEVADGPRRFRALPSKASKGRIVDFEGNQKILESKTDFIADQAFLCWAKGDLRFFLVESPVYLEVQKMKALNNPQLAGSIKLLTGHGRYNGYVRFPKLPLVAPGYKGIVGYVPVHGGITFFQEWWDGSCTYGFDTGHIWSGNIPEIINNIDWLMAETESLGFGIKIAARFEPYYLNARTEQRKAIILDRMGEFMPLNVGENFNVMMNLMSGEL